MKVIIILFYKCCNLPITLTPHLSLFQSPMISQFLLQRELLILSQQPSPFHLLVQLLLLLHLLLDLLLLLLEWKEPVLHVLYQKRRRIMIVPRLELRSIKGLRKLGLKIKGCWIFITKRGLETFLNSF